MPEVETTGSELTLNFFLDYGPNTGFRDYDRGQISFSNCWRYRMGSPDRKPSFPFLFQG